MHLHPEAVLFRQIAAGSEKCVRAMVWDGRAERWPDSVGSPGLKDLSACSDRLLERGILGLQSLAAQRLGQRLGETRNRFVEGLVRQHRRDHAADARVRVRAYYRLDALDGG